MLNYVSIYSLSSYGLLDILKPHPSCTSFRKKKKKTPEKLNLYMNATALSFESSIIIISIIINIQIVLTWLFIQHIFSRDNIAFPLHKIFEFH